MTGQTLSLPTSKPKITNFRFLMNATDSGECVCVCVYGTPTHEGVRVETITRCSSVTASTVTVASLKVGGVTCQLSGYVC